MQKMPGKLDSGKAIRFLKLAAFYKPKMRDVWFEIGWNQRRIGKKKGERHGKKVQTSATEVLQTD